MECSTLCDEGITEDSSDTGVRRSATEDAVREVFDALQRRNRYGVYREPTSSSEGRRTYVDLESAGDFDVFAKGFDHKLHLRSETSFYSVHRLFRYHYRILNAQTPYWGTHLFKQEDENVFRRKDTFRISLYL